MTDILERWRTLTFDTCTADAVAQVRCGWGDCQCADEISAEMAAEIERLTRERDAEIERLREELITARAEALKEAEQALLALRNNPAPPEKHHEFMSHHYLDGLADAAAAIRKLKEPTNA